MSAGSVHQRLASALRAAFARRAAPLAAAAFGLAYFVALTDVRFLDPRNVELLASGDLAFHVIARNFAQWDDWHWPVTAIHNYMWPVGTSTVFTDANPWITLLARLLLPRDAAPLQWIGPWLATCFALQGYFGARLAERVSRSPVFATLGGALFVLAPVLATRLAHDTLCGQWVILTAMGFALTPHADAPASRRLLVRCALLVAFAAGLHPTIFAMTAPIASLALIRHAPRGGAWGWVAAVACVGSPFVVWIAFGTLSTSVNAEAGGFGLYSANLLSLVDPMMESRSILLPVLPHAFEQYEGFGYLGLGVLVALAIGLVVAMRERRLGVERPAWALFAVCAALAVYAVSQRVVLGKTLLVDLSPLYEPIRPLTNAFRSSGRFIWPLHYVLVLASIGVLVRLRSPWDVRVLAAIVALQLLDLRHLDARGGLAIAPRAEPSPVWARAKGDYTRMVLDPPCYMTATFNCDGADYAPDYLIRPATVAARAHLALNSGQAARVNESTLRAYCGEVARARREGEIDPLAIYIPSPRLAAEYRARPELSCGRLDGYDVCVRGDRATPFLMALTAEPTPPAPP